MNRVQTESKGVAAVLTLPFWVFVDVDSAPQVWEGDVDSVHVRIYPPFRSGEANFLNMPHVRMEAVPFIKAAGSRIRRLNVQRLAVYPGIGLDEHGHARLIAEWGESWQKPPRYFPMDSLRMDVLMSGGDPMGSYERLAEQLLIRIRLATGQWWINRSSAASCGLLRCTFDIDSVGRPNGEVHSAARSRTVTGAEQALTQELWLDALDALATNRPVEPWRTLLLDAQFDLSAGDAGHAVLHAALACEIVKEATFERVWSRTKTTRYKRGKVIPDYELPQHIDENLLKLTGRSYKAESPINHEGVTDLWSARGEVAHGKSPTIVRDGRRVPLAETRLRELLRAAEHCCGWLTAI
ncbi:MAG: hypothetical protein U1F36_08355 [Planctomycetota bacterium]